MIAGIAMHSVEAEQAVLGALLLDHDRAALRLAEAPQLKETDFHDPAHGCVWAAVTAMSAASKAVDVITVFEHLRAAGQAEAVGGLVYLNAMAGSVPSTTMAGTYARIVRDHAMRRALADVAGQVAQLANEPGDVGILIDRSAALVTALERGDAGTGPRALSELVTERMGHWQDLSEGKVASGISTGLPRLDKALGGGLKPGRVIVLAARPSVGKTSLATQIGLSVGAQGHGVLLLSQEMPAADLADRIVSNLGRVNLGRLASGAMRDDDFGRLTDGIDRSSALPFYVDDQPALTLTTIRAKARQALQRLPLALLIVDYLQLCAPSGRQDNRHHQIEEISRGLKALAKELGITVLALSQLNRGAADREPELADLKESGAIEEDADTVILLHPLEKQADGALTVLAKLAKNRQGHRGRLSLAFTGETQRWDESDADVSPQRGRAKG